METARLNHGLGRLLTAWLLVGGLMAVRGVDAASAKPLARAHAHNDYLHARPLADALDQWAFCSLTQSPGARRYYDQLRARNKTHRQALRQVANRWVGILHTCLERHELYDEDRAWGHLAAAA